MSAINCLCHHSLCCPVWGDVASMCYKADVLSVLMSSPCVSELKRCCGYLLQPLPDVVFSSATTLMFLILVLGVGSLGKKLPQTTRWACFTGLLLPCTSTLPHPVSNSKATPLGLSLPGQDYLYPLALDWKQKEKEKAESIALYLLWDQSFIEVTVPLSSQKSPCLGPSGVEPISLKSNTRKYPQLRQK